MGRGDGAGLVEEEHAGATGPVFDFTVPDALLREVIDKSRDRDAVAGLELIPGTGEGTPPRLRAVLRRGGYEPLVLLTIAALIPGMFSNGINTLAPEIQQSFNLSDAGLGAVAFAGAVAQIAWGLPVAVWADHGSRKRVAAVTLLVFSCVVPIMLLAQTVWPFVFLFMIAAVGLGSSDTVHNAYLSDAYPTQARARIFAWHNLADPLAQTVGILLIGYVATVTGSWRWGLSLAALGIPVTLLLFTIREPDKGANESSFILKAAGMDTHSQLERAPRVLLGSAVTRLMRIRSIYYELVAVAILGFAGTGIPLFGSLYFEQVWHQDTAQRSAIYSIIGLSAFLGIPVAYVVGDRLFRHAPQAPLVLAGIAIAAYGGLFTISLYLPWLWLVVLFQFLANAWIAPLSISIFQTLAATAPPEMRAICFGLFGVFALVFGGFAGGIVLGSISSALGPTAALTFIGPVCAIGAVLLVIGSRYIRRDITLVIEDVLERYAEGKRRQAGGAIPAVQVHNLDFLYGHNQILYDVNLEVPVGEIVALLGTNGAGKSTLLRVIAGLEHPHRGVTRLFGTNTTYLEPEQILRRDTALLVGGKMAFGTMSVRDNLWVGEHSFRGDRQRVREAFEEALDRFPEFREKLDQPAGTLSGGEQQMLALSRVLLTEPKLLLIDELTLGLAPKTVDRLIAIVRRVNERGTTVVLVEQSANRASHMAPRSLFLERGTVRFDGPTSELLRRDDLLRPVFLVGTDRQVGSEER